MTSFAILLMISFLIISTICVFLVWHESYEDGVLGRLALGSIAFSSMMIVALIYDHSDMHSMKPALGMFIFSVTLFLIRHAYRFYMWNRKDLFSWKSRKIIKDH